MTDQPKDYTKISVSGKEFELTPEGLYPARCFAVADIGKQRNDYLGNITYPFKLFLGFKVMINDEVKDIWEEYTKSISARSNLGKALVSWRGKSFTTEEMDEFQLSNLLGSPCQIQIMHNDKKTWANVNNILPGTDACDAIEVESFTYHIDDPSQENLDKLPNRVKNKTAKVAESGADLVSAPAPDTAEEVKANVRDAGF